LTATNYFTKWIEVVTTRQATDVVIIEFLLNNILSRFGCLRKIVIDNAKVFTSTKLIKFWSDYNIILSHSNYYYPQGNGLAECSNKILVRIIKKLLQDNKKAWHSKLKFALRAYRVSIKKYSGTSPFHLVYGTDVVFPS
jgi:transposase InsO family protein